ncbi:flagellar biosynthesis protein [Sphingobium lignivorans]|uniref:Flagellar assembly protein FliH n=1 Tax=Sphingobium lignivorans TaxID=2735886 RepID=A0ABR6NAI5_9SPHN|nr:flagellar biosynthesis protein [Sphingobium lignivorans]MBB5984290.1 flagellar assembly protein FliH [Sphingobium lignivorans]
MSRIWSSNSIGDAAPIAGWGAFGSLAGNGEGFRSLYSEDQTSRAWNVTHPAQTTHAPATLDPVDPIEEASREGFLQGFQEGERLTREALEQDNAARAELASALRLLAGSGEGALATMLSHAVIRLVAQIVGEVPVDADVLQARCEAVAACIDGDDARAVLEVNPEDLPLLDMEQTGVALAANPALPRGSVRLATADGWVEDGPDVRLDRLRALMDDMEGRL